MSKWKVVPVELTPAMVDAIDTGRTDSAGSIYYNLLAAAPEWEPSDEDMKRAVATFAESEETTLTVEGLRTAILAAVRGEP